METSEEQDESLDFLSPMFDPLKALTTSPSKLRLPCPGVQPCDNLKMYEEVLQGTRRLYTGSKEEPSPSKSKSKAPTKPPQQDPPRFYYRSVAQYMRKPHTGPIKLLQTCKHTQTRVRVWIRHCVGVRGVCEGVPLLFDKHVNIVIGDVTEHFEPFKTLGNGGLESGRKKKRKKKGKDEPEPDVSNPSHMIKTCSHGIKGCSQMIENMDSLQTRHLSRLFIRGDNIVLISLVDTAKSS